MICTAAWVISLLLGLPGSAESVFPSSPTVTRQGSPQRGPDAWPRAAEGRWKDWIPGTPPPEVARAFLVRAAQAFDRGRIPQSLAALDELLRQVADYPPALHQAGVLYFRLRRYGDAIASFERYLAVAPGRVGDTRPYAHSLYSLGRYEEALGHYQRVLAVNPESPELLRGLALTWLRMGEDARALEVMLRVQALLPKDANALTWICQMHFDADRVEAALEAGEGARELAPFDPRPCFLLSQIHYELGSDEKGDAARARFEVLSKLSQSVRTLESRLLFHPDDPAPFPGLVRLHQDAGDLRAAASAIQRWLKASPGSLDARFAMLRVAHAAGDTKTAQGVATNLRRVAGRSEEIWSALEWYYGVTDNEAELGAARAALAALAAEPRLRPGDGR